VGGSVKQQCGSFLHTSHQANLQQVGDRCGAVSADPSKHAFGIHRSIMCLSGPRRHVFSRPIEPMAVWASVLCVCLGSLLLPLLATAAAAVAAAATAAAAAGSLQVL
jgi:hypothetical protein